MGQVHSKFHFCFRHVVLSITLQYNKQRLLIKSLERFNHPVPGCSPDAPRLGDSMTTSIGLTNAITSSSSPVISNQTGSFRLTTSHSISLSSSSSFSPQLICSYHFQAPGAHVMSTWTFHLIHNFICICNLQACFIHSVVWAALMEKFK